MATMYAAHAVAILVCSIRMANQAKCGTMEATNARGEAFNLIVQINYTQPTSSFRLRAPSSCATLCVCVRAVGVCVCVCLETGKM